MIIRIVKPVPPIKLNNHWVYRVNDTAEINLDEACCKCQFRGDYCNVCRYIEQFIQSKMEAK